MTREAPHTAAEVRSIDVRTTPAQVDSPATPTGASTKKKKKKKTKKPTRVDAYQDISQWQESPSVSIAELTTQAEAYNDLVPEQLTMAGDVGSHPANAGELASRAHSPELDSFQAPAVTTARAELLATASDLNRAMEDEAGPSDAVSAPLPPELRAYVRAEHAESVRPPNMQDIVHHLKKQDWSARQTRNARPPSLSAGAKLWSTNTLEERERIKDFWLGLSQAERRNLVKVEHEAVLKKMKEQQRHSCGCAVCGRKRTAIEEELEVLYDAYYEELEQYANHQQRHASSGGTISPPPGPGPFPGSVELDAHGAVLNTQRPVSSNPHPHPQPQPGVEYDNEAECDDGVGGKEEKCKVQPGGNGVPAHPAVGQKDVLPAGGGSFLNFSNSLTVTAENILTVADDLLKNDGQKFLEMMEQLAEHRTNRQGEAAESVGAEDYDEDEGDEEDDGGYEDYEDDLDKKMEDGKRMFSIFAAQMFEQRVLTAYREHVAQERQLQLLRELEDEGRVAHERGAKKAEGNQKKKDKKLRQKLAKGRETAIFDAEGDLGELTAGTQQPTPSKEQKKQVGERKTETLGGTSTTSQINNATLRAADPQTGDPIGLPLFSVTGPDISLEIISKTLAQNNDATTLQGEKILEKKKQTFLETKGMSATEMFRYLLEHGCVDFTEQMDPKQYSSAAAAGGGFGDVYLGRTLAGDKLAVKCLRVHVISGGPQKALKRIMREIYMWSKAKHPNIHELKGIVMFRECLGMVSPWMDNGNLRQYIEKNPNANRYQLCVDVAEGVSYLHSIAMVHGDIKGINILVSQQGVAKLSDFDHSILSDSSLGFSATTRTDGGTVRWMAPELLLHSDENTAPSKTTQTDVYALGMARTMLEIVTGHSPYREYKYEAAITRALDKKQLPKRPEELTDPNKPAEQMWSLLTMCWNHDPAGRPHAAFLLELLKRFAVGTVSSA